MQSGTPVNLPNYEIVGDPKLTSGQDLNHWFDTSPAMWIQRPPDTLRITPLRSPNIRRHTAPQVDLLAAVGLAIVMWYGATRVLSGELTTGDVVVFWNPNNRYQRWVQRIVGLPGDTIEIRNDLLFVNGQQVERREAPTTQESGAPAGQTYRETLDKANYEVLIAPCMTEEKLRHGPQFERMTVPNGHVFTLGDNRHRATDSRDFGPVPMADIIGRVDYIYLPRWVNLKRPNQ